MTIRTRTSLITAALIGCVVASITFTVTRLQRSILEADSLQRVDDLGDGVVRMGHESLRARDPFMLVSFLMFLKTEHPEIVYAAATGKDGHTTELGEKRPDLVMWSRAVSEKLPVKYTVTALGGSPSEQLKVSADGVKLDVQGGALVNVEEGRPAEHVTITLGFDRAALTAKIDRALRPLLHRTMAIAGVFMILGFAGAFSVGKLMTAPITALSAAVAQIKEGNLDVKVAVPSDAELGTLANRFNEMTDRLKELIQFREDILHTLTHEMNTPLSGLKGYLELWQDHKMPSGPESLKVVGIMSAAVNRMENSLGAALRLFKASAGLSQGPKTVVWVDELIREVCTLFALTARAKNITVTQLPGAVAECLYADEELVRQVVTNLISNALKYTPSGGRVTVNVEGDARELRFAVTDTGRGIKPEDIPHLFTKFYRTGAQDGERIPGTGLGLSIAQKAVQAMGGRITVESQLGKGTTFHVSIPKPAHHPKEVKS